MPKAPSLIEVFGSCRGTTSDDRAPVGQNLSREPSSFRLLKGKILYFFGQYEEALSEFRMILRLNWRDENAAFWMERTERLACNDKSQRQSQAA